MSITEDIEVIRHYVDIADGIAIPGAALMSTSSAGATSDPTTPPCCEIRDSFEFKLVGEVLRAKSRSLPPAAARSCSTSPPAAPCAWTCRAWARARPHAVASYPRTQRSRAPRRGRTGLAAGARTRRAQAHPDQLGAPLLCRSSGQAYALVAQATDGVPECIEVEGQPFLPGRAMAPRVHLADARDRL